MFLEFNRRRLERQCRSRYGEGEAKGFKKDRHLCLVGQWGSKFIFIEKVSGGYLKWKVHLVKLGDSFILLEFLSSFGVEKAF